MTETLAVVFVFAATALVALRTQGKKLEAKLGNIHVSVEDVNRAVNHRPAGDPTLYELTREAAQQAAAAAARLDEFMAYQHDRNHDMLNSIQVAIGRAELNNSATESAYLDLRARLDRLEARVGRRRTDPPVE